MRYRVYVGPRGSETISPLQKDQFLYKEFGSLDDAFGWARHINGSGTGKSDNIEQAFGKACLLEIK